MKTGFIGAGKVGFSIGKYLTERGMEVTGYYSKNPESSKEAAKFTDTRHYESMKALVEDSDAIFLTVPDSAIAGVWEQMKALPIQNKIISHFSGALSSAVFSDIDAYHAYGYSIHPLFAFHDRYQSYKEVSDAFFTIEGNGEYLAQLQGFFAHMGNAVQTIRQADKVRYHAAAAMASNLYVGLVDLCEGLLQQCGFDPEHAHAALAPLVLENAKNIVAVGTVNALTGPIERNDTGTVASHLGCLSDEQSEIYRLLSKKVVEVAERKHPECNFEKMKGILCDEEYSVDISETEEK